MKGSLAAMVTACERLLATGAVQARIAFPLTSDEEGPSIDGTRRVVEWLRERGEQIRGVWSANHPARTASAT